MTTPGRVVFDHGTFGSGFRTTNTGQPFCLRESQLRGTAAPSSISPMDRTRTTSPGTSSHCCLSDLKGGLPKWHPKRTTLISRERIPSLRKHPCTSTSIGGCSARSTHILPSHRHLHFKPTDGSKLWILWGGAWGVQHGHTTLPGNLMFIGKTSTHEVRYKAPPKRGGYLATKRETTTITGMVKARILA